MKWLIYIALCSCLEAQVPFDRILHADTEPGNWLTYSRDLGGKRYSPLSEINRQNVWHLKVKWAHQFSNGNNEVSPIVIDGRRTRNNVSRRDCGVYGVKPERVLYE
jgi:alcohol dehydrogenase (cytochrome c)